MQLHFLINSNPFPKINKYVQMIHHNTYIFLKDKFFAAILYILYTITINETSHN